MMTFRDFIKNYTPQLIAVCIIFSGILFFDFREAPFPVFQFFEKIEYKTEDLRFRIRGKIPVKDTVVIAAIDEKSLKKEGKWPWPRTKIADLIEKLSQAGATVIAFDIVFSEEDDNKALKLLSSVKNNISLNKKETAYLNDLIKSSDNDSILSETIKKSNSKIVLGYYFNLDNNTESYETESDIEEHKTNIMKSQHTLVHSASTDSEQNAPFITASSPETNIFLISDSADKSGFFNMVNDIDGIVRSMPVIIRYDDLMYAPLSLQALSTWSGEQIKIKIDAFSNVDKIRIGTYDVPADRRGKIWINFRGNSGVFTKIPVTDILNENVAPELFRDKIVIVGATAQGMFDLRSTPFGTNFPGCEIHAHIIDSILSRDLLSQPPMHTTINILIILLTGLLLGLILPVTGAVTGISAYLLVLILYCILAQYLFSKHGIILSMIYPLTVMTLVYTSTTVFKYLSESKKKKFISTAFSTYLAPSVVKQIIKSPEKLNLGGEEKDITAFFSDVQGFTSISEKLSANELVELLNEFLTEMTDIILKYEGTVDKFEGDAIIAFFFFFYDLENHARITCLACVEMQSRLAELNAKWVMAGRSELKMRIGLCSGTAVVGNMGSRNRMDYTMMGDAVNTAARLEGVNKHYGSYTMISETTKKHAGADINVREIDTIYLVGKNDPVTIYELTPPLHKISNTKKQTLDNYKKGLILYKEKNFEDASAYFDKACSTTPDDGPSLTMGKRCKDFMEFPPVQDWNGIFRITSK